MMKFFLYARHASFICFLFLLAPFFYGCAGFPRESTVAAPAEEKLIFVYLHGFGGVKNDPVLCANLTEFLEGIDYDCEVLNYKWDSVEIEFMKAGANWQKSEKRADDEAERFKRKVIDRFESEKTPYVLIGYSVGTRVILKAIERSENRLAMLRGVYFLGAAMSKDVTFRKDCLPEGMKIINYHSPVRDRVHQIAFNFMKEKAAGGRVGFDDEKVFTNYEVSCTHFHKGAPIGIDYSQMANAIGYVVFLKEGIFIPGEADFNIDMPVGKGDWWWNKILRMDYVYDKKRCILKIEQLNMNRKSFRAVVVFPDGSRKRIARGDNVHVLLKEAGALRAYSDE